MRLKFSIIFNLLSLNPVNKKTISGIIPTTREMITGTTSTCEFDNKYIIFPKIIVSYCKEKLGNKALRKWEKYGIYTYKKLIGISTFYDGKIVLVFFMSVQFAFLL